MRRRCEVEYSWRLGFLDALTLRTGEAGLREEGARVGAGAVPAAPHHRSPRRGSGLAGLPAAPPQELEELEVIPGDQTRGLYSGLQGAECPKLETLTLWRVSADVLDYPSFETVKHVGLHRGTGLAHLPNPEGAGATPDARPLARHGRGAAGARALSPSRTSLPARQRHRRALHGDTLTSASETSRPRRPKRRAPPRALPAVRGRHASRARGPELELELEQGAPSSPPS